MFNIEALFHPPNDTKLLDPAQALNSLEGVARFLAAQHPDFKDWLLQGESLEEASRFSVFSSGMNGRDAALAILHQQFKSAPVVGLWNGLDDVGKGATMTLSVSTGPYASEMKLHFGERCKECRLGDHQQVAATLALLAQIYKPVCAYVCEPSTYKLVYDDRVGVGWMIYLPLKLTSKDVPEARAVVPVQLDDGGEGTILVSVTDAVFDEKNTEHTDVAHAIETRLVDFALLPSFVQLLRPAEA